MKRSIALLCAVILFSGFFAASVAARERLGVEILGPTDFSGTGTFEVNGEAAEFLCPSGIFESANTRIKWLTEDTFKIRQDKVLTCDDTAQVFVLELKNTIVVGQGGVPGKGTWKLNDSTGFDPAPKGKGEIVAVGPTPDELREVYVGFVTFK